MTERDFLKLVKAHRLRGELTINACRLVLVRAMTAYAACKETGADKSAISKALQKLQQPLCPTCGRPMPKKRA